MKSTLAILTIVALSATLSGEASGADCKRKAPAEAARDAKIAFIARVKIADSSGFERVPGSCEKPLYRLECGARLNTMEVSRVLRGNVPPGRIKVISEDICRCNGQFFALGREYLVVAEPNTSTFPGDFIAGSKCDGTEELGYSSDARILKAWEEAAPAR